MVFELIQQYFVDPINDYSGYNLVNTLVYGLILISVAFFLVYPLFNRKGIKFDFKFGLALLPYILFGISLRILEDLKILPRSANPLELPFYFVTPGIWILIGVITIIALIASMAFSRKFNKDLMKTFGLLGLIPAVPLFLFDLLFLKEIPGAVLILVIVAVIYFIAVKLSDIFADFTKFDVFHNPVNRLAFIAQSLDGAATFTALQFFKCGEQHVVSNFIIQGFGPIAFLAVKIVLVYVILYFLEKEVKDKNLKGFIAIFIMIMGFATGMRDTFTLAIGSCS